jgi:hypothetical protein
MRLLTVTVVMFALFAGTADAVEPSPQFAKDTPYRTVRARLIRMGLDPVPVRARPGLLAPCPYKNPFCRAYPEIVVCGVGGGVQYCRHLFRRRSDGQLLVVQTAGEANGHVDPPDFSGVLFQFAESPQPGEFDDVVIASPARRDRQ